MLARCCIPLFENAKTAAKGRQVLQSSLLTGSRGHMLDGVMSPAGRPRLSGNEGGERVGSDSSEQQRWLRVKAVAIDEALERLAVLDADQVRVIELRFFAGLTVEETAHVLGRSPRTVMREWRLAKAWLYRELYGD